MENPDTIVRFIQNYNNSKKSKVNEIFLTFWILQFYIFQKDNKNLEPTFQGQYIAFKLIKKFQEWEMGEKLEFNKNILPTFYYRNISDFSKAVFF